VEFYRHAVANAKSQGRQVTDLVVIVDDAGRMGNTFDTMDYYEPLRSALLSPSSFAPYDFNAAVCISSLIQYPIGKSGFTGRIVQSLGLPDELDCTSIVREWWRVPEEDQEKMRYVAACVNRLPKAVEMIGYFLALNTDRPKDRLFMRDLFLHLKDGFSSNYSWDIFPDDEMMYSILFCEYVHLTNTVKDFIASGILLNSIERYPQYYDRSLIPETSLTVLANIHSATPGYIETLTKDIYEKVVEEILSLATAEDRTKPPFEYFLQIG